MIKDPGFFFGKGEVGASMAPNPRKKNTGADQFLDSCVSLCDNFADRMRIAVVSQ